MHSPLRFSFCRFVYICLAKYFYDYFRWCYSKTCLQYLKIYNSAEISIKRELDAIKVIKDIRSLKVINKKTLDNYKERFLIDHAEYNIIDMTNDSLAP